MMRKIFFSCLCLCWLPWSGVAAAEVSLYSYETFVPKVAGKVTEIWEYEGKKLGELSLKKFLAFDANHRLVSEKNYNSSGAVQNEVLFSYNDAGKIVEIRGVVGENPKWKYTYSYDAAGKMTEERSFDGEGNLEWKELWEYDSAGRPRRKETQNALGEVTSRVRFEYDENGNLLRQATFYSDGSILKRVAFAYEKKRVAEELRYNDSGLYEKVLYSYDEQNNLLLVQVSSAAGAKKQVTERSVSDLGGTERITHFDEAGKPKKIVQSFWDASGNVIYRHEENGSFLLRDIKYEETK